MSRPSDPLISQSAPTKRPHLPGLEALRGIAAVMIVLFHLVWLGRVEPPGYLGFVKSHFGMGVTLFFVISAFSLFYSTYFRIGQPQWVAKYFVRRFFRIAPLFYVMIVFWLIANAFVWKKTFGLGEVLLNFSFLFGLFPEKHTSIVWAGWTIGVEMLFYLVLPLLIVKIRKLNDSLILYLLLVLISVDGNFHLSAIEGIPKGYLYMGPVNQMPVFGLGIVAYFLFEKASIWRRRTGLVSILLLAGAAGVAIIVQIGSISQFYPKVGHFAWTIVLSMAVLSQALRPSVAVTNRVSRFAGKLSYSVYLLHPFLVWSLRPIYRWIGEVTQFSETITYLGSAAVTLGILFAASVPVYHFIEEPGIRAGSRLAARLSSSEKPA